MTDQTEIRERIPEPALIRGAVTAVVSLLAVLLGYELDVSWLEPALGLYAAAMPVALALWIRTKVSPAEKGKHAK